LQTLAFSNLQEKYWKKRGKILWKTGKNPEGGE